MISADNIMEQLHVYLFILISLAGHGFKLSPVVGKILSELALDVAPSYDLSPFSVDRFRIPAKL